MEPHDGRRQGAELDDAADLSADSLDEIELVMAIEDEFLIEITDEQAETMSSLDVAVQVVLKNLNLQTPV